MTDQIQIVTSPSELVESPPTNSHVKRIILEFEDRRFLPLPAPQFRDGGLYDGQNHVLSVRSRMLPVHRAPEVTKDAGYCESECSDLEYQYEDCELPEHVVNEMLERQHSLVFECNWWLEGESAPAKPKRPSFQKRVKSFFKSLFCCSCKCR